MTRPPPPRPAPQEVAITSLQNERVKAIRALDMRKVRRETGLFVAEGASVLISAREAGMRPETLVVRADDPRAGPVGGLIGWAREKGSEILAVSAKVMEKIAERENPQTLIGVFRQRWGEPPAPAALSRADTWLALEEVRDPGNLGTIIRTAHAMGIAGVLLAGNCCDPYQHEAVRASMGSIFAVPLARISLEALLPFLKDWPGDSIGTHLAARTDFRELKPRGPVLLVMGGEGPGLSEAAAKACKTLVRIPMAPGIDSLNLAIATALCLFQVQGPRLRLDR